MLPLNELLLDGINAAYTKYVKWPQKEWDLGFRHYSLHYFATEDNWLKLLPIVICIIWSRILNRISMLSYMVSHKSDRILPELCPNFSPNITWIYDTCGHPVIYNGNPL